MLLLLSFCLRDYGIGRLHLRHPHDADFSRIPSARSPAFRHLCELRLRWGASPFPKGPRSPADIFRYVVDNAILTEVWHRCKYFLQNLYIFSLDNRILYVKNRGNNLEKPAIRPPGAGGRGGTMTLLDAASVRRSQRSYRPGPIHPAQRQQLEKTISQLNGRSGLRLQLICGQPEPFRSLSKSYGLLTGVEHYVVFAGPEGDPDLEEKCGYYGEELLLTAVSMGLATCWVGGTYDKKSCLCHLAEGERLVCVAAIGYPPERIGKIQEAILGHRGSNSTGDVVELSALLCWADQRSRMCFCCRQREVCNWREDQKNETITD